MEVDREHAEGLGQISGKEQVMAYSPTMMRFAQQDPAGYVDGLNDYQFVADNPVAHRDATGLMDPDKAGGNLGADSDRSWSEQTTIYLNELARLEKNARLWNQVADVENMPISTSADIPYLRVIIVGNRLMGVAVKITGELPYKTETSDRTAIFIPAETWLGLIVTDDATAIISTNRIIIDPCGPGSISVSRILFDSDGVYRDSDTRGRYLLPDSWGESALAKKLTNSSMQGFIQALRNTFDAINDRLKKIGERQ
jgi:RHS repeat-associated protein